MHIPLQRRQQLLDTRDSNGSDHHTRIITVVVVVVILAVIWILAGLCVLRRLRVKNYPPKLLPGKFLKRQWNNWSPGKSQQYGQVLNEPSHRDEETAYNGAAMGGPVTAEDAPRRVTSVRSIITLPPYSAVPKPTEQVIAREGEREGMDIVVEFPETANEEETRRDEEMEALYQIRLRRRLEIAEREERRRQRHEARAQGDYNRLQQLSHESMASRNRTGTTAAAMLEEHRSRERDRRISAVTYAALGHVRHDGSRIRAGSTESDQHPLLDSASGIATDASNSIRSLPASSHTRSSTDADDGDVGMSHIPPPDYEHLDWGDAPAYESPVADRGEGTPHLPMIETLPRIHIDMSTPLSSVVNTPATATNSPVTRSQTESSPSAPIPRSASSRE